MARYLCGLSESSRVIIAICILGIESAAFGFAAEATRTKARHVKIVDGKCIYPTTPAFGFGLAAVLTLLIDQIIFSVYTRCIHRRQPETSRSHSTVTRVCFILSWMTSIPAVVLLLSGAIYEFGLRWSFKKIDCPTLHWGHFTLGTCLDIVSFALALVSYVTTASNNQNDQRDRPAGMTRL